MNLQNYVDFGADIINNFSTIPTILFETEILGTPLWTIVLGAGLGIYVGWVVIKFAVGL